jgi:hypothetical protein
VALQRRTFRQTWRRNWRDFRVLVRAFSRPLILFLGTLIFFGLLYWFLADISPLADKPGPVESIFLVLSMIFLQANTTFPEPFYLQMFFFIMPIIGIILLSAGAANLGVKLFNKSAGKIGRSLWLQRIPITSLCAGWENWAIA